jgi:GT2 family glycosyltransferase
LIIPVFHGWPYVVALLAGLDLRGDPELEIVVVDDASEDGGAERLQATFPDVHVHQRTVNGGFAAAVNSGVQLSSGEVLVVANSDLQLCPGALQTLIDTAQAHPDLILGPRAVGASGHELSVARPFPSPLRDAAELFLPVLVLRRLWRRWHGLNPRGAGPVSCDWVNGACLAFHRSVWHRTGPLDEGYRMYSEEVDWQRRSAQQGIRSAYLPAVTVVHDEMHGTAITSPAFDTRFRAIWRSKLRYHRTHGGRRASACLQLAWVAAYAVSAPLYSVASLVPAVRDRALAERRRVRLLAASAVLRRSL